MRGGPPGNSSICTDFHVEPNQSAIEICNSGPPCPRKDGVPPHSVARRLLQGDLTNWYFASSKHATTADVKKECSSDFVQPIAAPAKP